MGLGIFGNMEKKIKISKKENQLIKLEQLKIKIRTEGILNYYIQEFLEELLEGKNIKKGVELNLYKELDLKNSTSKGRKESLDIIRYYYQEYKNKEKNITDNKKIYEIIMNIIKEKALKIKEKHLIYFNLEIYMPNLVEITILNLIIWINNVEINEKKINIDKNKQFYYLINEFQKAKEIEEKEKILLELIPKIQKYVKYSTADKFYKW